VRAAVRPEVDDLLVIGAGRRGLLSRLWHGRVSRYCLAHSRCPVLAVPAPSTPREMGLARGIRLLRHKDLTADEALRHWDTAA
jgi:Universal stress protein family